MPTSEKTGTQGEASHVVKVTGMSPELLALLDARVKQQQATGRAEYIRELIRRDALTPPTPGTRRHKARRRPIGVSSEGRRLAEYHALVDLDLARGLSSDEEARLRAIEGTLNQTEARAPETQAMFARLEETAGKLDALLAAVQALPKAEA